MGIFDNIIFDEFTLLEGEQAEAYKKRKAEEAKKAKADDDKQAKSRMIRKFGGELFKDESDMPDRNHKDFKARMNIADRDFEKTNSKLEDKVDKTLVDYENNPSTKNKNKVLRDVSKNTMRAYDAADRHIRRHPKQYKESVFEDIEMI